jgi:hypothetical protein
MVERRFGQPEYNQIMRHRLGDMEFEMIHQTMPGDCVLINYLNTESLIGDGKIAMSPRQLRGIVVELRHQNHESSQDIEAENTALSYVDTVRLFSTITNVKPKQEDILTVDGRMPRSDLRNNIEHGVLEYLEGYESGLCTTGMGVHSRTVWKLGEDVYIVIDPMNPNGFTQYSKSQLTEFLTDLCSHQSSDNNFFFYLRSNENE